MCVTINGPGMTLTFDLRGRAPVAVAGRRRPPSKRLCIFARASVSSDLKALYKSVIIIIILLLLLSVYQVWSSQALSFGRYGARCVSALMCLVTLNFNLLTWKLMCKSHQRWGTFIPNLDTIGLGVFQLFAMYETDGRTDKTNAYCPLSSGRWHNNNNNNIAIAYVIAIEYVS